MTGDGVRANHRAHEFLFYASLGHIGVRCDLQEGHSYASRCQFPVRPSTKLPFLCAFWLRSPRFRAFRAQNRGFCAFLASGTPIFGRFEHKNGIFVRFCPSEPAFSGFSSTKSAFLCSFAEVRHQVAIGKAQLRLSAPSGSHTLPLRDQGCAHFSFCLRCHEAVIVYLCVL